MRRIHVLTLLVMTLLTASVWMAVFVLSAAQPTVDEAITLPTRVVIPTATPSATATTTHTPTASSTPTATVTPSPTATTPPTLTPTLAVRVFDMTAIMPGVFVAPTTTPFPPGTILLPAPPAPVEPLPDIRPEPSWGWHRVAPDHESVEVRGAWTMRQHHSSTGGAYRRTEQVGASLHLTFTGEAFRIRYVEAINMGTFEIFVNGARLDHINAEASALRFGGTPVYFVGRGTHQLEIRNSGNSDPRKDCHVVGIDAIQVFRATENTVILPHETDPAPTDAPIAARSAALVASPPQIEPTAPPDAPVERVISLVIAYDENANRAIDPAEGVAGIPVRLVEAASNRAIAHTFTDASGFAQMRVVTSAALRVVVPYFGQVWEIPARGGETALTLLLEAGTQPGLIP